MSKNMRKTGALLLLLIVIGTVLIFYKKIQESRRPNVIFILLDAARADHFSCYGYNRNTTPHIDEIARNGVIFENNFSQGTETIASVSKIFFSRYCTLNIIQDDAYMWGIKQENPKSVFKQLDTQQIFPTHIFSSYGYVTAKFSDHPYFNYKTYFTKQFDRHFFSPQPDRLFNATKYKRFAPDIESFIKNNAGRKFFVYLHIMCPHEPYIDGVEDKEFLSGADEKTIEIVKEKMEGRHEQSSDIFNKEEIKCLTGLYDSNLKYADGLVWALYEKLQALGVLNKTLIVITADHGENLGDHNLIGHGSDSWNSVVHTPLIIVYPSLIPKETKVKGLTESVDIMPTILDICNMRLPKNKSMDGISLVKYLKHPEKIKDCILMQGAIRFEKYKYILNDWLFNIYDDPQEKNNIIKKEPDLKNRLEGLYKKTMRPYWNRYDKSIRKTPLDYPFYIAISKFSLSPIDIIQTCYTKDRYVTKILEETSTNKAWLVNTRWESGKLFRLPNNSPSLPITLSSNFPNGDYKVYILLESRHEITLPLNKLGLRYRFNAQTDFDYPISMKLFRNPDKDSFFYYLYIGEITIKDKAFSLDIDFQPLDQSIYALPHIKFVPSVVAKEKNYDSGSPEKIKNLKSLGYL